MSDQVMNDEPSAVSPGTPRLWEIDHPYYCEEGNYYQNGMHLTHPTWADFFAEWEGADPDYNLVYRWDWLEGTDNGAGPYTGDDYYRNGRLLVFFMGQRKACCWSREVAVCRADEPAVREYLAAKWAHIQEIWAPFAQTMAADGSSKNPTEDRE